MSRMCVKLHYECGTARLHVDNCCVTLTARKIDEDERRQGAQRGVEGTVVLPLAH